MPRLQFFGVARTCKRGWLATRGDYGCVVLNPSKTASEARVSSLRHARLVGTVVERAGYHMTGMAGVSGFTSTTGRDPGIKPRIPSYREYHCHLPQAHFANYTSYEGNSIFPTRPLGALSSGMERWLICVRFPGSRSHAPMRCFSKGHDYQCSLRRLDGRM